MKIRINMNNGEKHIVSFDHENFWTAKNKIIHQSNMEFQIDDNTYILTKNICSIFKIKTRSHGDKS